jgi:hypothetical protein
MKVTELLRWQWEGYPRYHGSRFNLLVHIVAVPLFWAGNITVLLAFIRLSRLSALAGVAVTVFAFALQGFGHSKETVPAEPFTGPLNFVARVFLEQWVNFPRFVLSGGWVRALRR